MQTERAEMEYYGYTQQWVILCKNCKSHGTCRYEQHLGLDGYCSKAEVRKNVLLEADLTSEQKAYLKGFVEGMRSEPTKHGRWIWNERLGEWYCSNCDRIMNPYTVEKSEGLYEMAQPFYCGWCGARMDAQIGEDKSHPFAESVMIGMDGGEND